MKRYRQKKVKESQMTLQLSTTANLVFLAFVRSYKLSFVTITDKQVCKTKYL